MPKIMELRNLLADCHMERFGYGEPLFKYKKGHVRIQTGFFRRTIRSRNGLILVAEDDGEAVGFVCANIQKLAPILVHDREVHINAIFIKEGHRRKGIGRGFFREVGRWAKKKGIFSLGLMTHVRNIGAIKSYRKLGFEEHHLKMSRIV